MGDEDRKQGCRPEESCVRCPDADADADRRVEGSEGNMVAGLVVAGLVTMVGWVLIFSSIKACCAALGAS